MITRGCEICMPYTVVIQAFAEFIVDIKEEIFRAAAKYYVELAGL